MPANTVGFVPVADGEVPRSFTGYALEVISGGEFLFASGLSNNVVSSGADSFATTDIKVAITTVSGANYTGMALHNAGSNEPVSFITRGTVIVPANGAVVAGTTVACTGQCVGPSTTANHIMGRALTSAASGGYCIVQLGL